MAKKHQLTPLGQCKFCHRWVPPVESAIRKQVASPHGLYILYECVYCDELNRVWVSAAEAGRRRYELDAAARAHQERRRIGNLVKGFSVDLDAVDTLEDITLYWDHQFRNDPNSIPREEV